MTIIFPTTYTKVPDFTLGREIRATEWKGLLQANNFLLARSGLLVGSVIFDPYWETTNINYGVGNVHPTLDSFEPVYYGPEVRRSMTIDRATTNDEYSLWLIYYGGGIDIQITTDRIGGSASAVTSSQPNFPPEWVAKEIILSINTDPTIIKLQAKYNDSEGAAQARIYQMALYESREIVESFIELGSFVLGGEGTLDPQVSGSFELKSSLQGTGTLDPQVGRISDFDALSMEGSGSFEPRLGLRTEMSSSLEGEGTMTLGGDGIDVIVPLPYVYSGSDDSTVRKLDPSGNEIWKFEGHSALVLDVATAPTYDGFVYSGSFDNTVRKISPNGAEVWKFEGHTDHVTAVAVDSVGNVYSGSIDNTVRKIDSSGTQVWSFTGHTSSVQAVAVDADGFVYSASEDNTVRKISPLGVEVWSFGYPSSVYSVAVDSVGNVYSGSLDETVRKISPTGTEVWSFTGHTRAVYGVTVDSDGNVYSGSLDNTVRKIDSSGTQIWSFTGHTDDVLGVAVDSDGNVYSGSSDNTVRKINSSGTEVWSFTGHTSGSVRGVAVAQI